MIFEHGMYHPWRIVHDIHMYLQDNKQLTKGDSIEIEGTFQKCNKK